MAGRNPAGMVLNLVSAEDRNPKQTEKHEIRWGSPPVNTRFHHIALPNLGTRPPPLAGVFYVRAPNKPCGRRGKSATSSKKFSGATLFPGRKPRFFTMRLSEVTRTKGFWLPGSFLLEYGWCSPSGPSPQRPGRNPAAVSGLQRWFTAVAVPTAARPNHSMARYSSQPR